MPRLIALKAHALLLACAFAASCDSPSPAFMNAPGIEVPVEGSRFSVHRKGDRVEVYRTSFEMLPKLSEVRARAVIAIREATGCAVAEGTLAGDQAILTATLNC